MQLEALFDKLKCARKVFAPVEKEGYFVYGPVEKFSQIALDFTLPIYPAKEVMLPQRECIYQFKGERIKLSSPGEKTAIFGVRPCDIRAIEVMDGFMLGGIVDPFYKTRRENTFIVALQCTEEFENCFCSVFGTFRLEKGYDLALSPGKKGNFYVKAGSKSGIELLKSMGIKEDAVFPTPEFKITKKLQKFKDKITLLNSLADSKHWPIAADECFSCGGCTIVCPTCQCFDIEDHSSATIEFGHRLRTWDSCQLKPFTKVAGNHHFRGKRTERFRHRYYHKLVWGDNCVGCGRCVTICPTKIDLREVVHKL